jgi:hypothetical protein
VVKSAGLANGKRFVGPRISRINTNQAEQEVSAVAPPIRENSCHSWSNPPALQTAKGLLDHEFHELTRIKQSRKSGGAAAPPKNRRLNPFPATSGSLPY